MSNPVGRAQKSYLFGVDDPVVLLLSKGSIKLFRNSSCLLVLIFKIEIEQVLEWTNWFHCFALSIHFGCHMSWKLLSVFPKNRFYLSAIREMIWKLKIQIETLNAHTDDGTKTNEERQSQNKLKNSWKTVDVCPNALQSFSTNAPTTQLSDNWHTPPFVFPFIRARCFSACFLQLIRKCTTRNGIGHKSTVYFSNFEHDSTPHTHRYTHDLRKSLGNDNASKEKLKRTRKAFAYRKKQFKLMTSKSFVC